MNKEVLELAHQAQPELMQKTAMALKLTERMDPDFAQELLEEFEMISDVTMEKSAAAPVSALSKVFSNPVGKQAIGVAAVVGAGIAASLGTAVASDLYDAARRKLTKARNFKRIMEYNPRLKEEVNDPARIKPAYNAIHRYAPDFTADPMLGASLLKSLANQPPGGEHVLLTSLLGSRKNLQDVKRSQFQPDLLGKGSKKDKGGPGGIPPVNVYITPGDFKTPGATKTND